MASIDFHLGGLSQINPTTRPFPLLLNNYLQPDSTANLDHTTQQILDQFSQEGKPGADSVWAFANEVVDFAKYVPADHPAHSTQLCQHARLPEAHAGLGADGLCTRREFIVVLPSSSYITGSTFVLSKLQESS